jgi:hypothetical protein
MAYFEPETHARVTLPGPIVAAAIIKPGPVLFNRSKKEGFVAEAVLIKRIPLLLELRPVIDGLSTVLPSSH